MDSIPSSISHFNPDLIKQILSHSKVSKIPANTEILHEGQYIKVIPIVLEGLIKVFTSYEERDLLVYYIQPGESCIMSFAGSLRNEPSRVFAITEEDTEAILLPVDKVAEWTRQFPDINTLFFQLYNQRYGDLLDTISAVLFNKMDHRVLDYLKEKVKLTGKNPLKISHRQIANELGTAREVVSRVTKKLEFEGKLVQLSDGIKLVE